MHSYKIHGVYVDIYHIQIAEIKGSMWNRTRARKPINDWTIAMRWYLFVGFVFALCCDTTKILVSIHVDHKQIREHCFNMVGMVQFFPLSVYSSHNRA